MSKSHHQSLTLLSMVLIYFVCPISHAFLISTPTTRTRNCITTTRTPWYHNKNVLQQHAKQQQQRQQQQYGRHDEHDNINNSNSNNNNDNNNMTSTRNTSLHNTATTATATTNRMMMPLLMANPKCQPTQMSPTSLAYIGDVVYEMFIRCRYVWPTRRTTDLQNIVVDKVRAETQSMIFQKLLQSSSSMSSSSLSSSISTSSSSIVIILTPEEQTIISRGRNAGSPKKKSRGPKRLYNKSSNNINNNNDNNISSTSSSSTSSGPSIYQDSTALEALIGYSYLTNVQRCHEILEFIANILDEIDNEI